MNNSRPKIPITDIKPPNFSTHRVNNKSHTNRPLKDLLIANTKQILLVIVFIAVVVIGGLLYNSHRQANQIQTGKGASNPNQINVVVEKVSKLILLPTGEQPTMAIVNDASKYTSTSFFKNAANGDRLLIYAQAREAILYRPSINKIIAVAPLSSNPLQKNSSTGQ